MHSSKQYLCYAAFFGFCGVALGAFGAHALRESLDGATMSIYKTAVNYHMWHALALAIVSILIRSDNESRLLVWAARLLFAGILLFSGSLYVLSVSGIRWLGAITPLGGTAFLIAWGLLFIYSLKTLKTN